MNTEKERLATAAKYALQLREALREVLVNTDNLALDELVSEMIGQVVTIRRRLVRFADGE